jgi:hypothetical protein
MGKGCVSHGHSSNDDRSNSMNPNNDKYEGDDED